MKTPDPVFPHLTMAFPGDVYLHPVQTKDEAYWLSVRNNTDAVKWSRTPKPITSHAHHTWFIESLDIRMSSKRRLFLIIFHHRDFLVRPIGIARMDHRGSWTELSIVLEPFSRGRGVGTRAIQALCSLTEWIAWPTPGAVVSGKNRRSLKTFLKAGFSLQARRWVELRRYKKREK